MTDNYTRIVRDNLSRLYADLPGDLALMLPAEQDENEFILDAFCGKCRIRPDGIYWDAQEQTPILSILISLYALHARADICIPEPFRSF